MSDQPRRAARHGAWHGGYRTEATLRRVQDEADGLLDQLMGIARQVDLIFLEGWLRAHADNRT
jgi:hypothetical protein